MWIERSQNVWTGFFGSKKWLKNNFEKYQKKIFTQKCSKLYLRKTEWFDWVIFNRKVNASENLFIAGLKNFHVKNFWLKKFWHSKIWRRKIWWSKIKILVKNQNFGQTLEILVKNQNFGQTLEILVKNQNFGQTLEIWAKILW